MRVIICGSRNWPRPFDVRQRVSILPVDTTVVTGGAAGVDTMAHNFARNYGLHSEVCPAAWDAYGKRAGVIRNAQMLDKGADLVIAFWDGSSPGTKDMMARAKRAGVALEVHYL